MKEYKKSNNKKRYRVCTFYIPDKLEDGMTVVQTFKDIDILWTVEMKKLKPKYSRKTISTIEEIIEIFEEVTGYELLSLQYNDYDQYTLTFWKYE